ncbi:hypothetical protein THASP1DRAFT_33627 [Thamnocephalis sphaerospora]|uniref:Uncharacterized protein n=1 Tax=Thamnocephalis sphaerospora TaxID=78915 RepID=A0A4P9XG91_9FUNG|nr:hypothetical protein THASP1DRAFT_33627 [Thamnocephalis sphaerospora]|eukprot:RKP04588.1 hypothetical protein THASP1DRAFT_33627 [Thamnocephalis sphaerospora]
MVSVTALASAATRFAPLAVLAFAALCDQAHAGPVTTTYDNGALPQPTGPAVLEKPRVPVTIGSFCGLHKIGIIFECEEPYVCDLPPALRKLDEHPTNVTLSEEEKNQSRVCLRYRQNIGDFCDDKYCVCVNGNTCVIPSGSSNGTCQYIPEEAA